MTAAELFGVALTAAWGAAGAIALGRAAARSPAPRELAAALRSNATSNPTSN